MAAVVYAVLLSPRNLLASHLHMVPSIDVRIDENAHTVSLKCNVKNDGDEPAHEVALDLPALNESYPVANVLPPGESGSVDLSLPFDKLGMQKRGGYALLYRILYKDANLYSFSAPYSMSVVLAPAPSRVLSGASADFSEIAVSSRATRAVTVQNVSSMDATIERIEPVAPVELALAVDGGPLPLKLAPGEQRNFDVHVTRSGALLGSTYVMGLVASGVAGDRHFAERVSFTVRVVGPFLSGRALMGGALAALVIVSLLVWTRKNRSPIRR